MLILPIFIKKNMCWLLIYRCQCGHCEVLPSFNVGDCLCCREIPEVATEGNASGIECITQTQDFDPAVLNQAVVFAREYFAEKWRRQACAASS